MEKMLAENIRVLSISPAATGVGFAVMEGRNMLVAWGKKSAGNGDKNGTCLAKIMGLIDHYEPGVLVMEDIAALDSSRSKRIRNLFKQIEESAKCRKLEVETFSRTMMREGFFAGGRGSKHARAEILATRFPEQLAHLLPSKRRAWETEKYYMPVFDAVALAVQYTSLLAS